MPEFGPSYSRYYDTLYFDKDYEKECDYLESLFEDFSSRKVRKILDIACGTGGHTIPLAKRGYTILARDISSSMLSLARKKVEVAGLDDRVRLERGDMRDFRGHGKFDACICMFAAIGYISNPEEVLAALRTMRRHIRTGGLLVFDCWNGLAVLTLKPSKRRRKIHRSEVTIIRTANPRLDPVRNLCRVKYRMVVIEQSGKKEFSEIHEMRYFYPEDIRFLLRLSKFKMVSLHPFLQPNSPVGTNDWNLTTVAVAIN